MTTTTQTSTPRLLAFALFLASALAAVPAPAAISPQALELRDLGLAELENERPEKAAEAYRQLIEMVPGDPLGHANLAIALLRQQQYEPALAAIDAALEKDPGDGDLLAIKAEILQWKGELEGALALMREAVAEDPEDLEVLYTAYQLATTVKGEAAEAMAGDVLERLAALRPENVVVLLQLGQRAIADGDRATATGAFLRVAQLLWQVDPVAARALRMVNDALRQDDLESARVPAVRLENVLKISPMFRESLRELRTGIQGIPIKRFEDEPEPTAFGDPIEITFAASELDPRPTAGRALATGDFDGDEKPDVARIRAGEGAVDSDEGGATLEVRLAAGGWRVSSAHPAPGLDQLLAADLDNDGHLDLLAFGPERGAFWRGAGDGSFAPAEMGLASAGAEAATVIDFDVEGDLDVAVAGGSSGAADLYRNNLQGPLEQVGDRSLPRLAGGGRHGIAASDLDRDGDLDLVLAGDGGIVWLDNLRQGRFTDRTADAGLGGSGDPASTLRAVVAADLDADGHPDLATAGDGGIHLWRNTAEEERAGHFERWTAPALAVAGTDDGSFSSVLAEDLDNDGRLDLAAAGDGGVVAFVRDGSGGFAPVKVTGGPDSASAVAAADLDRDGDLDLVAAGPGGLHRLENRGGNRNRWLDVRLRGLTKGNSKNNVYGVGSVVEVHDGRAYQFREAAGDVVHFGLGSREDAEVLRVVWTNGVPQNRISVSGNQRIVEEQLLKGSCPFLYAWDGERFVFVTDLLWGAPLGLPVAPGAWASADPSELVRIDGLADDGGVYRLRVTEELWEAAFFDHLRLWVVDHPAEVEVASSLKVIPGETVEDRVLASRELRPVAAAWDGAGREVTVEVRERDEVYADGYRPSPYQGVAAEPWTFTFDLGESPREPVRLHLDGWIFPADASLNLAVAQRGDLPYLPPRVEVETGDGWRELMASPGFPAGKTKTMVIDLPPLPPGATRLRLVTNLWLHWDRIAWTTAPADSEPMVRARLLPAEADLRYRGFSALVRHAPNAPHAFDYQRLRKSSPWLPFPGRYTRFGDVRELLREPDDFSVILAPGDEIALRFDARHLPPPKPGHRRTLFLESHGWDKDADRNTFEAQQLEPLPFRAMSGYPYGPGEHFPDTPAHRDYREDWLTREVQ